ncbi:MAG: SnoaL-like domain-containing protein [Saprospiraceae bacterium]|nr:SnoaL-like domain-containing protein [Saprospiraceae bacterium]
MKLNILVIGLLLCSFSLQAQKKMPKLPMDNKAGFEKFMADVYNAYYEAYDKKNYKNFVKYFSGSASEIGPDGNLTYSLKSLKEMWPKQDQMLDSKPKFDYKLTSSRMVNSEIALITWDVDADIMVKGNQVGGRQTNAAILKKSGSTWVIEFSVAVPFHEMPAVEAPPAPAAPPEAPVEEKKE